jgi:predicted permease
MHTFFHIFSNIIIPIFIIIGVGFVFQKKVKVDVGALNRVNLYIMSPVLIFYKIYTTDFTLKMLTLVFVYCTAITIFLLLIGEGVSRVFGYSRNIKKAFNNSIVLYNSGNYGLPMNDLAFNHDPFAMTIQIFILIFHNITTATFGVFNASSGNLSYKKAFKKVFLMPSLYSILIAILVKMTGFKVPQPIMVPMEYITNAFIALALLTLGIQLAEVRFSLNIRRIILPVFLRLVITPLLGVVMVLTLGIKGVLAQALVLGVSTPTAVNASILSEEFKNEPEYVSQVVFASTAASAVTVSIIIHLVKRFL